MEDIKHDLEQLEGRLHRKTTTAMTWSRAASSSSSTTSTAASRQGRRGAPGRQPAAELHELHRLLGIDARIVTAAVEKHYEGLLGEAGASGYEYLDKIVQIPFRIPQSRTPKRSRHSSGSARRRPRGTPPRPPGRPSPSPPRQRQRQRQRQRPRRRTRSSGVPPDATAACPTTPQSSPDITRPRPDRSADHGPDISVEPSAQLPRRPSPPRQSTRREPWLSPHPNSSIRELSPYLRPNPRHLKRLINVYRLVRALALSRGDEELLANPAALLRWLVMWSQWPATSQTMLSPSTACSRRRPADRRRGCRPAGRAAYRRCLPGSITEMRDRLDDEVGDSWRPSWRWRTAGSAGRTSGGSAATPSTSIRPLRST